MTTLRTFSLSLFLILLTCSTVRGQGIARNSFAFGLESGPVTLRHFDQHTAQVGMAVNYQYKFEKFFALRAGITYRYMAPVKYTERYPPLTVVEKVYTHSDYNFGYRHFSLQLSPCLYWRQEDFALIAGFSGGIGNLTQKLQIEDFYYFPANTGQSSPDVTTSRESATTYGYGPVLGISIPTGSANVLGELEVSISYQRWDTPKNQRLSRTARTSYFSYSTYGLQVAYRVNF